LNARTSSNVAPESNRVRIRIGEDCDLWGERFKGAEFAADLVCYHAEAKAWVVKDENGRHFFVPRKCFSTVGSLKVSNPDRSIDKSVYSFTLKDGGLVDAMVLYEFEDGKKLYRLIGFPLHGDNFYGGYHMCGGYKDCGPGMDGACSRMKKKEESGRTKRRRGNGEK
jgi:hypothetical protein